MVSLGRYKVSFFDNLRMSGGNNGFPLKVSTSPLGTGSR